MTPDQVYSLLITLIFTGAICFCFYLYHKAHGRDVDAVQAGGKLVMEALHRDGRIMGEGDDEGNIVAFNYGDDDSELEPELEENTEYNAMMERLRLANLAMKEQQADKEMENMNEKV